RRTSSTASALLIGVALVAFITVFAASGRASISSDIDTAMKSDWLVETQFAMGGLSPVATQQIAALPETGAVTALRYFDPQVGGTTKNAVAMDTAHAGQNVNFGTVTGDLD